MRRKVLMGGGVALLLSLVMMFLGCIPSSMSVSVISKSADVADIVHRMDGLSEIYKQKFSALNDALFDYPFFAVKPAITGDVMAVLWDIKKREGGGVDFVFRGVNVNDPASSPIFEFTASVPWVNIEGNSEGDVELYEHLLPAVVVTDGENFYVLWTSINWDSVVRNEYYRFYFKIAKISPAGKVAWNKVFLEGYLHFPYHSLGSEDDMKGAIKRVEFDGKKMYVLLGGIGLMEIDIESGEGLSQFTPSTLFRRDGFLSWYNTDLKEAFFSYGTEHGKIESSNWPGVYKVSDGSYSLTDVVEEMIAGGADFAVDKKYVWYATRYGLFILAKDSLEPERVIQWQDAMISSYDEMGIIPQLEDSALRFDEFNEVEIVNTDRRLWILGKKIIFHYPFFASLHLPMDIRWSFYPVVLYVDKERGYISGKVFYGPVREAHIVKGEDGEVFLVNLGADLAHRESPVEKYEENGTATVAFRGRPSAYAGTLPIWSYGIYKLGFKGRAVVVENIIGDPLTLKDVIGMKGGYLLGPFGGTWDEYDRYGYSYTPLVPLYIDDDIIAVTVSPNGLLIDDRRTGKIRAVHIFEPPTAYYDNVLFFKKLSKNEDYIQWSLFPTYSIECMDLDVEKGILPLYPANAKEEILEGHEPVDRRCYVNFSRGGGSSYNIPLGLLLLYDRKKDIMVYASVYLGSDKYSDERGVYLFIARPSVLEKTTMEHYYVGRPVDNAKWHHIDQYVDESWPIFSFWDYDYYKVYSFKEQPFMPIQLTASVPPTWLDAYYHPDFFEPVRDRNGNIIDFMVKVNDTSRRMGIAP